MGLSASESDLDAMTWDNYYTSSLLEISEVTIPNEVPSVVEDSISFINEISLTEVANYLGITLPAIATTDNVTATEYRFPDGDSVLRARYDKQSLRFYFGDRRSPPPREGETALAFASSPGIVLAEGLYTALGLPQSQKGEIATDVHGLWTGPGETETSAEETLSEERRWEDSRIVYIGRTVGGWRVHHSKLVIRISNTGELVSGRINWPAFSIDASIDGLTAKSDEELAEQTAMMLQEEFKGRSFRFSAEPEMVWIPLRDGMMTTFKPVLLLSVSSHAGEDPVNNELYIDVY